MDSVPLVCITGQVPTHLIGTDAFQEADTTGISRPATKHNYLVKKPKDLCKVVHEAFEIASTGRPGPVLIDLPKDVQLSEVKYEKKTVTTSKKIIAKQSVKSSEIKKSDLINNSSAIASIEFDENVTTVATLKMLNPTWLQLRDEENNIVLSKLMDKDEEFSYELKLNYNITAGNAGNILVLIDDEVRGKIGKYGDILDSFVLYKDFTN